MKRTITTVLLASIIDASCNNPNQTTNKKITEPMKTNNMMIDKKDFTATILVNQDPSKAFNAIKNFRAWWSEEIEGNTDRLNEVFFYHYKDIHLCKIKLVESVPDKKLVYQVVDNQFNFIKDQSEWVNTKLIFNITKEGSQTKVQFTHEGLVPEYECYAVCNDAWTGYITRSLYNLITTGKGAPNPAEGEGFNAELAEKWKLNKENYTITIVTTATANKAFECINNVKQWWTQNFEGNSQQLNDEFSVRFGDVHFSKQKLIEVVPGKKVVWLVTESKLNFISNKQEWNNTKISFELFEKDNATTIRFTHHGLVPEIECYDACSNAWSGYIQGSLLKLINTGKGGPSL